MAWGCNQVYLGHGHCCTQYFIHRTVDNPVICLSIFYLWSLCAVVVILKFWFQNTCYGLISWALHATEPYWWYVNFGLGNGLVPSGNGITWAYVSDVLHHLAPPGHNQLTHLPCQCPRNTSVFQTCLTFVWRLPSNFTMYYIASSDKCLTFHCHISRALPCCIYVSVNWVSFGSDNGLSPIRRQAII